MSDKVTTGVEAVEGAAAVAAGVQSAVSQQSNILAKIESGFEEFLQLAPTVAGAIDPKISAASVAIATIGQTLIQAISAFHANTTVPAANAATKAVS